MNMKRIGLWVIGTGVLLSVGLLTVGQGHADDAKDDAKGCPLATLKGQYLFSSSSMLFPPAFGLTVPAVANSAGYHIFNGDGTGMDFVTFTINGVNQHVPSPVPITYTLNSDCTGTLSVQNGPNFDIFVAVDGSQLSAAGSVQGRIRADDATRCTLDTLEGQYLFAGSGTLFPPAFGVTAPSVENSAGYHIFNGDGTGMDFVKFTVNGVDQNVPSPVRIKYTLNSDCTGTLSVQNGPNLDIFVAVDGSELSTINTDKGVAAAEGPDRRVGPK
jgi:hypothetical protein